MRKHIKLFVGDITGLLRLIMFVLLRKISVGIKFPNVGKHKEVIILANGPSLEKNLKEDIDYLKEHDIIMLNFSPNNKYFFEIKPKYLIVADPIFYKKDIREDARNLIDLMVSNLELVMWNMIIYMPYEGRKKHYFSIVKNPYITIKYYNTIGGLLEAHQFLRHFLNRITMPPPLNVLISCIFIAIKMNYSIIKIIGADHSWFTNIFVGEDNLLYIKDKHYYNLEGKLRPWYKYSVEEGTYKVHEMLGGFANVFKIYWQLNIYAQKKGIQIYNCTPDSFIDAFERAHLNKIIK